MDEEIAGFATRITPELKRRVKVAAATHGMLLQDFVAWCFEEALASLGEQAKQGR